MKILNLKKKHILNTLFSVVPIILMTSANAEIITFEFEGVITNADDEVRRDSSKSGAEHELMQFRNPKAFSPGDKFSGTYTYDSSSIAPLTNPIWIYDYKGAASSISIFHDTNVVAEATSGSVFYSIESQWTNSVFYKTAFSASQGSRGKLEHINTDDLSNWKWEKYTPSKIELSWIMPYTARGSSSPYDPSLLEQPHFDSTKNWTDENSWTLPGPNYGDFSLEYAQTGGAKKAVISGKVYSVTRVNNTNNNCTSAEYIPNTGKLLISAMKIGNKMYDVILKKAGTVFTLTKIDRITGTTCQQAEYIPSEGRIKIPKLTINNKTYKTTLKKTSGNDFKIENISPI